MQQFYHGSAAFPRSRGCGSSQLLAGNEQAFRVTAGHVAVRPVSVPHLVYVTHHFATTEVAVFGFGSVLGTRQEW